MKKEILFVLTFNIYSIGPLSLAPFCVSLFSFARFFSPSVIIRSPNLTANERNEGKRRIGERKETSLVLSASMTIGSGGSSVVAKSTPKKKAVAYVPNESAEVEEIPVPFVEAKEVRRLEDEKVDEIAEEEPAKETVSIPDPEVQFEANGSLSAKDMLH